MNFSWISHDILIAFHWLYHDFLMTFSWLSYDFLMIFSCISNDFLMSFSWLSHYFLVTFSCLSLDLLMTLSWLSHDFLMTFLLVSNEFLMNFSWLYYAFLITLSWISNDFSRKLLKFLNNPRFVLFWPLFLKKIPSFIEYFYTLYQQFIKKYIFPDSLFIPIIFFCWDWISQRCNFLSIKNLNKIYPWAQLQGSSMLN